MRKSLLRLGAEHKGLWLLGGHLGLLRIHGGVNLVFDFVD
jgi:hypothetical protein